MLTLALAMRASEGEGEPLPGVFPQLEALGAKPRRGQVTLVAAGPGAGKSALVSDWIINLIDGLKQEKLTGMYFSADTDRMTLGKRAAAGIIRCTLDEAEEWLKDNSGGIWDALESETSHVWACFDPQLTMDDIDEEIKVFAYVTGAWPEFVVVDVLMNVHGDTSDGDHTAFAEAMKHFHTRSRETNSAFFVLHHVTGNYENSDEPIPLGGILGKVTKLARLVLTLHRTQDNMLGVSVVKNSSGKADTSGWGVRTQIPWLPERSWFGKNQDDFQAMGIQSKVDDIRRIDPEGEEEDYTDWKVWGSHGTP